MNLVTYTLQPRNFLSKHTQQPLAFLRDGEFDDDRNLELHAHVRSGDYFAALATRLDAISDTIDQDNHIERACLQQIADELLTLQRTYKIIPK
jgi:hypothetical protein